MRITLSTPTNRDAGKKVRYRCQCWEELTPHNCQCIETKDQKQEPTTGRYGNLLASFEPPIHQPALSKSMEILMENDQISAWTLLKPGFLRMPHNAFIPDLNSDYLEMGSTSGITIEDCACACCSSDRYSGRLADLERHRELKYKQGTTTTYGFNADLKLIDALESADPCYNPSCWWTCCKCENTEDGFGYGTNQYTAGESRFSSTAIAGLNIASAVGMTGTFLWLNERQDLVRESAPISLVTNSVAQNLPELLPDFLQIVPRGIIFSGFVVATSIFTLTTFVFAWAVSIRRPIEIGVGLLTSTLFIIMWLLIGITLEEFVLIILPWSISFGIFHSCVYSHWKDRMDMRKS